MLGGFFRFWGLFTDYGAACPLGSENPGGGGVVVYRDPADIVAACPYPYKVFSERSTPVPTPRDAHTFTGPCPQCMNL
jgi:hypothetical protein